MQIRRLGFAGLQVTSGDSSLVIDYFTTLGSLADYVSAPDDLVEAAPADLALVTHLHRDHADAEAIRSVLKPRGRVLRPVRHPGEGLESIACAEAEHALHGLPQQVMKEWQTVTEGPFTITAVPAVDGFGDPQVSWVIEADGTRILHAGDTLFHGSFWLIAMRCGPIDVSFLPVNGAVCDFPHRQPSSPLPACMDPLQAATAASLLQARLAVPIHYGLDRPPIYAEVPDPAGRFLALCEVPAEKITPGELLSGGVSASAPAA